LPTSNTVTGQLINDKDTAPKSTLVEDMLQTELHNQVNEETDNSRPYGLQGSIQIGAVIGDSITNAHVHHESIQRILYNGYTINCAFGESCTFKDNREAQDLEKITAKCRICNSSIHDLCSGGEDGSRTCPSCL